jgi:hypothetical protein
VPTYSVTFFQSLSKRRIAINRNDVKLYFANLSGRIENCPGQPLTRQEALVFLGGPAALRLALFLGGGGLFGLGGRFQRIRKQLHSK